jgi:hypothetical protein
MYHKFALLDNVGSKEQTKLPEAEDGSVDRDVFQVGPEQLLGGRRGTAAAE